jgi:ferredoxin
VRINVTKERCTGHAMCGEYGPNVYTLGDDGINDTESQEVLASLVEEAQRGASACPEQAIALS